MRHGISLLEVLVSIFVLTVGLLGVAMVIPAGNALMAKASDSDRGGACARASMRNVQVRGWIDSELWYERRGPIGSPATPFLWDHDENANTKELSGYLVWGESFFLDPAYFSFNLSSDAMRHFPYDGHPEREFVFWGSDVRQWPERAQVRRVGLNIPLPVLDRIVTWGDELIFTEPKDGRPEMVTTSGIPTTSGNFTWAAMITPNYPHLGKPWDHDSNPSTPPLLLCDLIGWNHDYNPSTPPVPIIHNRLIEQWEVSIVVFHKRRQDCPQAADITSQPIEKLTERSCYANVLSGGDVELFVSDGTSPDWLEVKKDDWLMLKALPASTEIQWIWPKNPIPCATTRKTVCQWYRVVGVDDIQNNATFAGPSGAMTGLSRYVTLSGADWTHEAICEAVLVEDVIDVHTAVLFSSDL